MKSYVMALAMWELVAPATKSQLRLSFKYASELYFRSFYTTGHMSRAPSAQLFLRLRR